MWLGLRSRLDAPVDAASICPAPEGGALLGAFEAKDRESILVPPHQRAACDLTTRLGRGRRIFAKAKAAAARLGCPFGWRLAEVPGVGHDSAGMFSSPQAAQALQ
jgi:hypothetical protein